MYRERSELWRRDVGPTGTGNESGFSWISADDRENSVLAYVRRDGEHHCIVVLNLTPVPRAHYRVGAPEPVTYRVILDSDSAAWGGSGYMTVDTVAATPSPFHGYPQSVDLALPPLSVVVLAPERSA